jgi:hypothetical protein
MRAVQTAVASSLTFILAFAGCSRAPQRDDGELGRGLGRPERLFSESPAEWFEGFGAAARVSPDGRWAIYGGWFGNQPRIIDLQTGREAGVRLWPGLDSVQDAVFGPGSDSSCWEATGGRRDGSLRSPVVSNYSQSLRTPSPFGPPTAPGSPSSVPVRGSGASSQGLQARSALTPWPMR